MKQAAGLLASAPVPAKTTRRIRLGPVPLGGGAPVAVQTMTDADPHDPEALAAQIRRAAKAGAEIVRLAVPDERAAAVLKEMVPDSPAPLVADIHFDWRLAVLAAEAGAAGLRINPGNIGGPDKVRAVAEAAGRRGAVIRVGVNSGSLEKRLLARHGGATPEALAESALAQTRLLEETGFRDLKVSLKGTGVGQTVAAVRRWAHLSDIPQHIGITEAGDALEGAVKSAVGLGTLLAEGLGDTLRVSLTAPPEEEARAAWALLRALGLRARGVEVISCPACGRAEGPVGSLAAEARRRLADITTPLTAAVMGCVVNGPGEAKNADVGLALGRGHGLVFAGGRRTAARAPFDRLLDILEAEARRLAAERTGEKINGHDF